MNDPRRTQQQTGDSFDFGGKLRSEIERMTSQGRFGAKEETVARAMSNPGTRHAILATSAAMAFWLGPIALRKKRRRQRKAQPPTGS